MESVISNGTRGSVTKYNFPYIKYMQDYAVTYRKHAKKADSVGENDFKSLLEHLGKRLATHCFEKDKGKDHVHMHGVIKIPIGFFRKKLVLEGFNMKIKLITDMKGWLRYLAKDRPYRSTIRFEIMVLDAKDREEENSDDSSLTVPAAGP